MRDQFPYDEEASREQRELLLTLAIYGHPLVQVYSKDIALAFQLPHPFLCGEIELYYSELRCKYGKRVCVVQWRKKGSMRVVYGYFLPLKAALQVLINIEDDFPLRSVLYQSPAILFLCFARTGFYTDSLN